METLTEIMDAFGTDKGTTGHGYAPLYESWFEPIREMPLRLLEIGVCDPRFPGASLGTWHEYFPNADIFGFDILDARQFEKDRIKTFIGDQSSTKDLTRFIELHGTGFDLVIDDGSHIDQHQQASLNFLFDHLKPHGQYIIEDMEVAPNTLELMLLLQGRAVNPDPPAWRNLMSDNALDLIAVLTGGRTATSRISRKSITKLSRGIESVDLGCANQIARIVKRP